MVKVLQRLMHTDHVTALAASEDCRLSCSEGTAQSRFASVSYVESENCR